MTNKGIVIISDPIIPQTLTSHNLDLSEYVFELALKLGFSVQMGQNVKSPTSGLRMLRRVSTVAKLLKCCVLDLYPYKKNSSTILYINPNANPIWLLISNYLSKSLSIKIKIHAHFIGTHDLVAFQKVVIIFLVKSISKSENITLSAETETYSRFLSRILGKECQHLPFPPIDQKESRIEKIQIEALDRSPKLRLVFLGAPRNDKGIFDLPLVIKGLGSAENLLEFRYQKGMPNSVTGHNNLNNVNLIQLPEYLTKAEFYNEIVLADIVLIPYLKEDFELRGSSICQRAIYTSSKILIRAGTSLVMELEISVYRQEKIVAKEFLLMSLPMGDLERPYSEIVDTRWSQVIQ
jgi:hypothetical protein